MKTQALVKLALPLRASYHYGKRFKGHQSNRLTQVEQRQDKGKKISSGTGGMSPFLLTSNLEADRWVLNEDAPGIARLIKLIETEGLLVVSDRLHADGFPGYGASAGPQDPSDESPLTAQLKLS